MSATGSSPRRSRSQLTSTSSETSPEHRSSKRAFSAAASPRNIGPREKRARRSDSPSRSSPFTAPSKLFDAFSAVSMPSPPTSLFMNLASSAPATPLLPATSSSFFPTISLSTIHNNIQLRPSLPPSPRHTRAMLNDLHREAFTSLRQSLAQSGEGFLRRMRDWEERRNMENSNTSMLGVQERGRDRRRACRHRTSHTNNHTVGEMSYSHPRDDIVSFPGDVSYPDRDPGSTSGYRTFLSIQDDSDTEDDMLTDNVGHSHTLASSERTSRSGSLGRPPIDVPDSQELFAVDLAEMDAEHYSSAHCTSTFDFPFTYSNTRSSSPFALGNTTDDESSSGTRYDQPHSGCSSPYAMSSSVDWTLHTISTRNQPRMLGESGYHSSPDTSPRPSSSGFSRGHLATRRHVTVQSLDNASTPMHPRFTTVSETSSQVTQTASDKALAALVFTLANGSGSLADYGYVREAQGELEELEAGGLWE